MHEQQEPTELVRRPRRRCRGGSAPCGEGAGWVSKGRLWPGDGRLGWCEAPGASEWGCAKGRQRTPEGTKGLGFWTATRPSAG